jgi:hypothetical protein
MDVLPSRRTIKRYLDDASYPHEFVAQQLLNNGDHVVTLGLDDATKAAGHRHYVVKGYHISIVEPTGTRHACTEKMLFRRMTLLRCLAVLSQCSVEELKNQIYFWMSDRATDCDIMFDHLEVDPNKRLKCYAHIILCVVNA